ncbi:MAG: ogr/Delta-like zinc finger family protein [Desulfobacter sp.]|nr:ogr/Delta-like zinc finger family protein [Desulfobacter sp.]WDP86161.1 MAG: ogr/Delta-like zinc finger family protein [Desulfobacter sp.]
MKIKCNRCGFKAVISSSSEESEQVKKLYCCCKNPNCGHTFVMDLAFSHTLSPSALDIPEEILTKIHSATRMEQQRLFKSLSPAR